MPHLNPMSCFGCCLRGSEEDDKKDETYSIVRFSTRSTSHEILLVSETVTFHNKADADSYKQGEIVYPIKSSISIESRPHLKEPAVPSDSLCL